MIKEKLQDQVLPGSVGGAVGVIWTTYGAWLEIIPPDLGDVERVALTGAIGIVATALVNLIRRNIYPERYVKQPNVGERRSQEESTS